MKTGKRRMVSRKAAKDAKVGTALRAVQHAPDTFVPLVPKLQLGNALVIEAPASTPHRRLEPPSHRVLQGWSLVTRGRGNENLVY